MILSAQKINIKTISDKKNNYNNNNDHKICYNDVQSIYMFSTDYTKSCTETYPKI